MKKPVSHFLILVIAVLAGQVVVGDPYAKSQGSWGQPYADQWALQKIGLESLGSERKLETPDYRPIVAVIDTGLDYFHPDMPRENVWRNSKEVPNRKDDDGNGYVDDLIGWNFVDNDNNPWDWVGHGTHVSGVIAAARGNGEGIAGVHPNAIIMPLKAMNLGGRGYSTRIAEAVYYAVQHGADIINLSMAVNARSRREEAAIDYAVAQGVLVVAAAGNEGQDVSAYGPASFGSVLTVAATDHNNERAPFSNFGQAVDISAPGEDILSLRAARTDFVRVMGSPGYGWGDNYVGENANYYRASGTSFAAPFVSGAAALLLSANPQLTPRELTRVLKNSARDIGVPGVDQNTGYGLLDVTAALAADPAFYITANIDRVEVAQIQDQLALRVIGTADSDRMSRAELFVAPGNIDEAKEWIKIERPLRSRITADRLFDVPAQQFTGRSTWTLRLVVEHENGQQREARFVLNLG